MAKNKIKTNTQIEAFTGRFVDIVSPEENQIDLLDIAHSLSNQCRYGGHSRKFYSVAEHSVRVSERIEELTGDKRLSLIGLLHDASEAYLVDIPTPIKAELTNYKALENNLMNCIFRRFGLPTQFDSLDPIIHEADFFMLSQEAYDVVSSGGKGWKAWGEEGINRPPKNKKYKPRYLRPAQAKRLFLSRFYSLCGFYYAYSMKTGKRPVYALYSSDYTLIWFYRALYYLGIVLPI